MLQRLQIGDLAFAVLFRNRENVSAGTLIIGQIEVPQNEPLTWCSSRYFAGTIKLRGFCKCCCRAFFFVEDLLLMFTVRALCYQRGAAPSSFAIASFFFSQWLEKERDPAQ